MAQNGRLKLARLLSSLGYNEVIPLPDISTKAKAQEYIGLDMEELEKEKDYFKENIIPKWLEEAKQREEKLEVESVSLNN
ncbi:ammonia-forming cytochrome c nitrite reductase subunit c552 [Reichenbachiella carrageenanivorans]|uniref:Ammonia-forming cytochrome c nitrite reductase subunit c552 n=1 Tax=Reichenbachiella carrageenanivorans TaxID=2979869 RepID=A0ABY6CWS8_9BACT|nr:ammonia-forming cytochrome c nitrite reductase subunit c552 [Reichenbachiella carrageenanivorans]